MKNLEKLLRNVPILAIIGSKDIAIDSLQFDIEKVEKKTMFFGIIVSDINAYQFIEKAIDMGANTIVCEVIPEEINEQVTYIKVENILLTLSLIASNYYGNPTKQLKMIGVTGTNGKTSTATLLYQIFRKLGHNVGLLSTVVNKVNDLEIPTYYTTPYPTEVQRICKMMVDANCEYCFMELSSHGIHEKRAAGIHFAAGIFTNITHDHVDFHGSFEKYLRVKKSFLDSIDENGFVVGNIDNPHSAKILADVNAILKTVSVQNDKADFFCKILKNQLSGLVIELNGQTLHLQLRAEYNAYNVLSAYAAAVLLGEPPSRLMEVLPQLLPIAGRFDYVESSNGVIGVVDYAHTPDAFLNLYETVRKVKTNKLISIIGCAGDRDRGKRPQMTKFAYEQSDFLIITADNPRKEDPAQIIDDMLSGLTQNAPNVKVIWDRKAAIEFACTLANEGDIILLTGKGHENYQDVMEVKHPWNDKETLKEMMELSYMQRPNVSKVTQSLGI